MSSNGHASNVRFPPGGLGVPLKYLRAMRVYTLGVTTCLIATAAADLTSCGDPSKGAVRLCNAFSNDSQDVNCKIRTRVVEYLMSRASL